MLLIFYRTCTYCNVGKDVGEITVVLRIEYNAHEMLATVRNAERVFYDNKREWNKMVDRAMAADFSWSHSAKQYEEMYNWLIGE